MTLNEILQKFDKANVTRVKLGTFDIDGVLRGKHVSRQKFESAAATGLGFCDVIFGWDIGDVLYDKVPVTVTGWHTGYPDATARVDLESFRLIPWEAGTAFFLLDLFDKNGEPLPMAPRQVLRRVLARAPSDVYLSAEYEFFLFRETPQSLRDKSYLGLTSLSPGMFGYSVLRASANSPVVLDLFDQLAAFNISLEGLHTETGPGVFEGAIAVDHALAAADKAALFKTAVKEICSRHQILPTFMAKWSPDLPGSGGHIHQSLWNMGRNIFHGDGVPSPTMLSYIAGLIRNLTDFMPLFCPTINSYKRIVPGTWAPINATWGIDNRTAAVRAIPGSAKSARVEMRVTGADGNPYLAMAACVAAGLDGIANELEPPSPVTNAYEQPGATPLPRTLAEATSNFYNSARARDWFGDAFVEHFAATRQWEIQQFNKAVTNWELSRYFELI